jgi:Ca2+:H+ antiporter
VAVARQILQRPLYWLLILMPAAGLLLAAGASPTIVLLAAALAIVPLAGLLGQSTEVLAAYSGPRVGGLLNATLGNAAELIITVIAIREGLLELVKASITGSIIGNLLLVLGASMLAGGLRHGLQTFDRRRALGDCILLLLAVAALAVPSLFVHAGEGIHDVGDVEILSLGVALLMILTYGLGLLYSFRGDGAPLTRASAEADHLHPASWSRTTAVIVLAAATAGVVWMSEILVSQVEPVVSSLGVSEFFLGIILVPIIGNVAEHTVAVSVALKNQISLSVEIAVGSSLQIALFVAPALVFLSLALGNPLTLVFNNFELIALIGTVIIVTQVAGDGESNWLEGVELVALYLIFAIAFFLLPLP